MHHKQANLAAVDLPLFSAYAPVAEARIMEKLGTHPHLVQFYRWAEDRHGNEFMIMELIPGGGLDKFLAYGHHFSSYDKLKVGGGLPHPAIDRDGCLSGPPLASILSLSLCLT